MEPACTQSASPKNTAKSKPLNLLLVHEPIQLPPSLGTAIQSSLTAQSSNYNLKTVHSHGDPLIQVEDNFQSYQSTVQRWQPGDAEELAGWAHLLVVAPATADNIAKMLHGSTDSLLLEILRVWDVSKKILLLPGMSTAMWEHPLTQKHLSKIRRKWTWIKVLEPILWTDRRKLKKDLQWEGLEDLTQIVKSHADLMAVGCDHDTTFIEPLQLATSTRPRKVVLPTEILSIVLQHLGDWEIAQALGIYTTLPIPTEWHNSQAVAKYFSQKRISNLEWAILTDRYSTIIQKFETHPPLRWLSQLCVKLIIKFARTDILSFLEVNQKDLFWSTFGHTLPIKASAVFGQTSVLEWWRTSPSFLTKEYTSEALDGASGAGFVHILSWWRDSGLPLRYTEAALERASSKGHIAVLEWWRRASHGNQRIDKGSEDFAWERVKYRDPTDVRIPALNVTSAEDSSRTESSPPSCLPLKIGKSFIFAAQNGQADVLKWWATSSLPTQHEDRIAHVASANGHVNVLETWKGIKGDKMQIDNQVLPAATIGGHANVLEWWRKSGYRVEYRICEVEEALEDCMGGPGEDRVREWWAKYGLNLGVGTSEWMKVKIL
ncbi:hypothetical protein MMC20_006075 [Loxospora ochrophaea]|nr:hypothetical protein [Loxospora ochrophaea]